MIRLRLMFCTLLAISLTACVVPPAQPMATPQPPSQLLPTQPPATLSPDEPVSATPLPTDSEFGIVPLPQPYAPQPDDAKLQRGKVYIEQSQLLSAESFPPQFFLSLSGSLPTPCHQLRITTSVDVNQRIAVNVYSLNDPQAVCTQVLEPFTVSVPLSKLVTGQYVVWLNGQSVGEIVAP